MPLQNRVTPDGSVKRYSAKGTFMGNRGVLHDSRKELKRQFKTKAWITCLLEFKGRKRELMSPNAYTELFFLDEVTAFAAGHRPCAECRRTRYNEFRDAWMRANAGDVSSSIRAPEMDEILHRERMDDDKKLTWQSSLADLPHGTMFIVNDESYAVCDGKLLKWSFSGYGSADSETLPEKVDVLTPRSVVNIFTSGFRPEFHPTATL
ncbi:hypothetical protein KFJ24_06705 [Marinobacter sediminum]|uniref:hypothetical protein n=1 Tax=Marinobacter sediminum TaxID=256323 RepID=UPI0020300F68|nr:hypothetical protein [Marinobacter sediminum]MCM0612166.1 hypothetical protein [Marinobacter sediminum]